MNLKCYEEMPNEETLKKQEIKSFTNWQEINWSTKSIFIYIVKC